MVESERSLRVYLIIDFCLFFIVYAFIKKMSHYFPKIKSNYIIHNYQSPYLSQFAIFDVYLRFSWSNPSPESNLVGRSIIRFFFFILSNCARGMPQRWGYVSRSISGALRGNQFQKTQKLYRDGFRTCFYGIKHSERTFKSLLLL